MKKVSLTDFAEGLVARLPQAPCRCRVEKNQEEHCAFSSETLSEPPPLLHTSSLVMTKTERHYGNCCRIDAVHFYATGQTHRELAILILSVLFSKQSQRVAIDLEHEASDIKRLEINWSGSSRGSSWDYTRRPARFIYHPEIPERIPWSQSLDQRDLPTFDLDFTEGGHYHPVNDLDKRNKVEIGGNDDALVLVAELLLNIGLPACDIESNGASIPPDKTYVLECNLGRQRVGSWSAEAQFHLPNSFSWPGKYPSFSQ